MSFSMENGKGSGSPPGGPYAQAYRTGMQAATTAVQYDQSQQAHLASQWYREAARHLSAAAGFCHDPPTYVGHLSTGVRGSLIITRCSPSAAQLRQTAAQYSQRADVLASFIRRSLTSAPATTVAPAQASRHSAPPTIADVGFCSRHPSCGTC